MSKAVKGFIIPKVDIIKAGLDKKHPLDDIRDDDGYISITRSKDGKESKRRAIVKELEEQEAKLNKLKELADNNGLSKKQIKNTKEDIEHEKQKKEEKAIKKASKYMDPYFSALISGGAIPSDMKEFVESGGKKKKKKKDKKQKQRLEGLGINDKKKKKSKSKDQESEESKKKREDVAESFRAVEKISKQNLETIDETMAIIDDRLKEITGSGDRMKSKDYIISNYISAKSSLISTRQKIATDIGSNRAKIYDIELKREKNTSEAASDANAMIAKLFPNIALGGKTTDLEKYIAGDGKNKDSKHKKKNKHWDEYDDSLEDDELDRRLGQLDDDEYESSSYDKNIEYEGKFTPAILFHYRDSEWKFVALDTDGNRIEVPKSMLPNKKACSMKFDDQAETAIDLNTNRCYQVIYVP